MRSYIFTDVERRRLRAWLEGGDEDQSVVKIFVEIRRNLTPMKKDVEILSQVIQRLRKEGRLMGRVRLHERSNVS